MDDMKGAVHEMLHPMNLLIAPIAKTNTLCQGIEELPKVRTFANYTQVPVMLFGAAIMHSMAGRMAPWPH